ncbi:twin-arginine translocase subunit TatB [Alkalilimnicola ehrlichii]|uniref:Sec-independent protein translocase protein TatB n=1 Tax=Alkalilimnicola ehrlichii TaxID=351052 RepID=A0A3E0WGW5_9GAMM|nr:Sec-independent protein translocase protein TatB [Alkalilimnicola ehrlichii]RFA24772.1 twin-arginine translocase subunit TatB [Alkalilimnicola ehrlichii]RFA31998.1 twin-arginine translocase subunit TatB [Alkalilimnicola ehrlichii]
MFDVGFWEVGLILVIALLILGPERLPRAVRVVGFWIGRARGVFYSLRAEMDREFQIQEMRKAGRDFEEEFKQMRSAANEFQQNVMRQADNARQKSADDAAGEPTPDKPAPSASSADKGKGTDA